MSSSNEMTHSSVFPRSASYNQPKSKWVVSGLLSKMDCINLMGKWFLSLKTLFFQRVDKDFNEHTQ